VVARTRLSLRDDTLVLVSSSVDGDRTSSTWRCGEATIDVTIEKRTDRERQLSCGKDKLEARPTFVEV